MSLSLVFHTRLVTSELPLLQILELLDAVDNAINIRVFHVGGHVDFFFVCVCVQYIEITSPL